MVNNTRGSIKNTTLKATKSNIIKLHKKLIKEPTDLFYTQAEKRKSYANRRKVKCLGLKNISKKQNISNKDIRKIK